MRTYGTLGIHKFKHPAAFLFLVYSSNRDIVPLVGVLHEITTVSAVVVHVVEIVVPRT